MSGEEITQWLGQLGQGNADAAAVLWQQYFARMVELARRHLGPARREADEEDVALSAMHSFCRGMAAHRFQDLHNRHDLWKLLITITARKACAQRRKQFALKRGGGRVRGESVFLGRDDEECREGIGGVLGHEPTPELANMVAEDCRRMLDELGDDTLRQIALLTLQGYGPEEIGDRLGCVRRTVERKLERIREKWAKEIAP